MATPAASGSPDKVIVDPATKEKPALKSPPKVNVELPKADGSKAEKTVEILTESAKKAAKKVQDQPEADWTKGLKIAAMVVAAVGAFITVICALVHFNILKLGIVNVGDLSPANALFGALGGATLAVPTTAAVGVYECIQCSKGEGEKTKDLTEGKKPKVEDPTKKDAKKDETPKSTSKDKASS